MSLSRAKKKTLGWIALGAAFGIILSGLTRSTGGRGALLILSTACILTFLIILGLQLISDS